VSFDATRFQQILDAARNRTVGDGVDTMVVAAHLSQMRLFMLRQGVEFFARQDSFNQRREFLRRVVDFNELSSRMESIIDSFLIDGKGLLYFRPAKDLYRIHYFSEDQYRTYYDEDGFLEEVQVIYSFKVRPPRGFGAALGSNQLGATAERFFAGASAGELRWIRLRVFADRIEQSISPERPQFGEDLAAGGTGETLVNSLGFIPATEVFNNRGLQAGSGHGEFNWLGGYILQHDRMVKAIKGNLRFFGTPTLVSSRPRHDLIEPDGDGGSAQRATISSSSGFVGLGRASTRVSQPTGAGFSEGLRVPRIIANVEAADRVGYITPDPVSGDLTAYAQAYQEMIRAALGGVDDLSISSGATAFEVRTLYGRVATTATRKNRDLLEYGFCRIFALMIHHEETIFRESLAQALGFTKPDPVLVETLSPEQVDAAQLKYDKALGAWQQQVANAIEEIKRTGEIPPDVVGLIPDGDARVDWRWTGQVFEDSPQDILNNSIVCRNLQELGVSSIEALQYLFPQKTPEERAAMLSGYPFRMVEATQRSAGIFVDLIRAGFQVPHPQEPDLPLAADPQLDLVPYIYRTLDHLRRELSYSGQYSDVDFASIPPTLSDADRLRASRGESTELERSRAERRSSAAQRLDAAWRNAPGALSGGGAYTAQLGFGNGPAGAALAGGLQSTDRRPDAGAAVYGMGGTLSYDPTRVDAGAERQLGNPPAGGPGGLTYGSPDLLAPSNAGVLTQPGGGGAVGAAGRGRPDRSTTAAGSRRPRR
jgi:hypothetical protein